MEKSLPQSTAQPLSPRCRDLQNAARRSVVVTAMEKIGGQSFAGSRSPMAVARLLRDVAGLSSGEVALALHSKDGLRLSLVDVCVVLHALSGLNLNNAKVALALHAKEGLGLDAQRIAVTLLDPSGLALDARELISVLRSPNSLALTFLATDRVLRALDLPSEAEIESLSSDLQKSHGAIQAEEDTTGRAHLACFP